MNTTDTNSPKGEASQHFESSAKDMHSTDKPRGMDASSSKNPGDILHGTSRADSTEASRTESGYSKNGNAGFRRDAGFNEGSDASHKEKQHASASSTRPSDAPSRPGTPSSTNKS